VKRFAWMHPSIRDLLIDELITNAETRRSFLDNCSLGGIELALSVSGGKEGERIYPLLRTTDDWAMLQNRICEFVRIAENSELHSLLQTLDFAVAPIMATGSNPQASTPTIPPGLIGACLEACAQRWDGSKEPIPAKSLQLYYSLSLLVKPLPPSPGLQPTMDILYSKSKTMDLISFARVIEKYEPRFLKQAGFPGNCAALLTGFLEECEDELENDIDGLDEGELDSEESQLSDLASSARDLSSLSSADMGKRASEVARRLEEKANECRSRAGELREGEDPWEEDLDEDRSEDQTQSESTNSIFEDL
jgi:hypothetical protein